jgi:hypothetical protein
LDKVKSYLQAFLVISSAATATAGFAWATYGWFTTDEELQEHNVNPRSHQALLDRIEVLEGADKLLFEKLSFGRNAAIELGARIVRLIAADAETNRALKAAAADYREAIYRRSIESGHSVESAVREAIATPWFKRPL